MTKYACSRCEQEFDDQKEFFKESKVAHEQGRHKHHTVINERDGSESKPMGNFDYGPVEWNEIK